jgi:hypothetical protein
MYVYIYGNNVCMYVSVLTYVCICRNGCVLQVMYVSIYVCIHVWAAILCHLQPQCRVVLVSVCICLYLRISGNCHVRLFVYVCILDDIHTQVYIHTCRQTHIIAGWLLYHPQRCSNTSHSTPAIRIR